MTSTLGPAQAIPSQDIPAPASYGDAQRTGLSADNLRDGMSVLFASLEMLHDLEERL